MARQVIRLTDKQIKTTNATGKEFTLSDGDGLQLRVRANGTKSWQFKYKRPTDRKSVKLSLGTYPQLSLANARKKINELHELIAKDMTQNSTWPSRIYANVSRFFIYNRDVMI